MEAHTLVDLSLIRSEDRTSAWSQAVPSLFPGMKVSEIGRQLSVGLVKGARLASGRFWMIDSGPLVVSYSPRRGEANADYSFSLMLQLEGATCARQRNRRDCKLGVGALCMIDESAPFQLEIDEGHSKFVFLQIPRTLVVNRYPYFEHVTASAFLPDEPGVQILGANFLRLLEANLEPNQQWAALAGFVQFLGILEQPRSERGARLNAWRVERALSLIEAKLCDPLLTADDVADEQSISRRQLDRAFQDELGETVTAHIWTRRLRQAALTLRNPAHQSLSITRIALASGFEDAAHFSRAFRKRYNLTPGEWRRTA